MLNIKTIFSYSDVIRHDVDDPSIEVNVTGNIKITVDPTFSDLTLESTLNSVDIGTCAALTILLSYCSVKPILILPRNTGSSKPPRA